MKCNTSLQNKHSPSTRQAKLEETWSKQACGTGQKVMRKVCEDCESACQIPKKKKRPQNIFPTSCSSKKRAFRCPKVPPWSIHPMRFVSLVLATGETTALGQAFQSYASTLRTQAFIRQGLHTPDKIHWKSRRIQEGVACILGTSMSPTALWATFYAMSLRWPSLAHLSINSLMQWRWRKGSIQCFALGGSPCNSKKNWVNWREFVVHSSPEFRLIYVNYNFNLT